MKKENLNSKEHILLLLIDDNDIDNYVHVKTFEHYGDYNCTIFKSAYEGFEHLRQTSRRYDYIILDIYMPEMDGFTFVEHFNRLKLTEIHGPIIFLTASLNPSDRVKADEMGLQFIEKPLKIDKLVGII
ncbi:MAG: ATP-binding region ATPase domain protein [Bacteroidota bacterium]|jgi:CheY-like chemotaxis protein|nr:ATP-binding region ATPase domain protein [Bacteroidota bacterium]